MTVNSAPKYNTKTCSVMTSLSGIYGCLTKNTKKTCSVKFPTCWKANEFGLM